MFRFSNSRLLTQSVFQLLSQGIPAVAAEFGAHKTLDIRRREAFDSGMFDQISNRVRAELLVRKLGSPDWRQRVKAAEALTQNPHPLSLEMLCALVSRQSPEFDPGERIAKPILGGALARRLDAKTGEVFEDGDRHPVRQAAARALASLGDPRAVPSLIIALEDSVHYVVCEAARSLAAIKDERAILPLASLLKSTIADEVEAAAQALSAFGRASLPIVVAILQQSQFTAREGAAKTLGLIGDKAAVAPLMGALRDSDYQVRRAAIRALVRIGGYAAASLIESTRDPAAEVRAAAAAALGQLKEPAAIKALTELELDAESEVRETAFTALSNLGWAPAQVRQDIRRLIASGKLDKLIPHGGAAVEPLIQALRVEHGQNRKQLEDILPQLGPTAISPLREFLMHQDYTVRHTCAHALEALGWTPGSDDERSFLLVATGKYEEVLKAGRSAFGALTAMLEADSEWDREMAVKTLGSLQHPEALEPLLDRLKDPAFKVREAAARSLSFFRGPRAVDGLHLAAKDAHYNVRAAAITSLREHGINVEW